MTSKVYEFLSDSGGNNFTESAPRPPVPGEENELQSNGGMSTQSSGSHKSHVSSKSNKSQSSTKSTKSAASTKGEISHSPAATPRKSNLEKSSCSSSQKLDNDEMEAPNGYEPEGSAANSPPFTENSTPPHLKWAENLNHLLSDSDGVQLFKDYLDKEGGGALEVDFWFACQGLKRKNAQTTNITSLVKAIYKHFVRNDGVRCLQKETKQEISDKINKRLAVDQYIYDTAENEVETYMRNVTYPAFLNSDFYVQYVQSYGDSPKSSHSSGSNSARPVSQSGPLPSLPEDKELDTSQEVKTTSMGPPLFHKVPSHKPYSRSESSGAKRMETISGPSSNKQYPLYSSSRHSSYPNHVSYAPASAQDSELQSLSSDALTDDTMSVTDSSIDASHYNMKRQRKAMKSMAQQNRETNLALHSQFIPRTERAPKDRNIAETDPARFAQMLIEKLQQVLEEREAGAKVDEKLRCLSEGEDPASTSFMKNTTATSIIPMMSTSAVLEEETAESILDQHCSRIWANSNHHTPSRSPGRHSPRNKSPDLLRLNKTLPAMSGHRSRKRGEKCDFVASCDSGVGEESCSKETHRHIHHHHHHHHPPRELRTTKQLEYEAQKYSMACIGDYNSSASRSFSSDYKRENERGRTSKKGATRKGSDASSHIDSGISMVFDKDSLLRMPLITGPTSEKVMQWMMDSERVQDASCGYQDSEKGSSHKNPRHRLNQSAGPSLPTHKQISKKAGHGTSRSASVERSTLLGPWTSIGQSPQILPSQPFAQDTSMPLPPPPNPTTQLEEARRRLEDQSRSAAMASSGKRTDSSVRSSSAGPVKSKSFAGVPSREKSKVAVSQSASQMRTMPSAKTVPSDLDMSGGSQTFERPKTKRPPPAPNTSMNTSTSAAAVTDTIVGIYFGQEPIPYRHVFPGRCMTLAQFKTLITKKGNFKYYFKRDSDEFGEGAVFEEIGDDSSVLPMWQDKIVAKVEKID